MSSFDIPFLLLLEARLWAVYGLYFTVAHPLAGRAN
jgi:hypothetical protein